MTPSETLLRLCLGGFGKIKQRLLLAFVRFTGPFSRPKNPSKTCAPQRASPVGAALGKNAASFNLIVGNEYVFKASINWLRFGVLRLHVAEEMVAPRPDCAIPKK